MSTVTNIVTTEIQDSVSNLYIAFFGRAPDAQGFGYWCERMAEGESVFKIAQDFALSREWISNYGGLTPEQQVNRFYQNTFGRDADQAGLEYWVTNIEGGLPFSTVAFQIINAAYLGGDNVDPNDHALVLNKIEVAQFFALELISNDTSLAATAFNGVTQDPTTVTAAKTRLDISSSESYTLTTGTDIIYGTDSDDVFQGEAVSTALLPGQTLNTTDNLNGGAGYNVLNAQLVDFYTVPAGLKNIQEINLTPAPGIAQTVISAQLPFTVLDLVNADAVQVLGFNGFALGLGSVGAGIDIKNVTSDIDTINFSNIFQFGEDLNVFVENIGEDLNVFVENIGESLSGESDTLDLNFSNVLAGIGLSLDQSQNENYGYNIVNINVEGSTNDFTGLNLDDVNGTINTVTLAGDVTSFGIAGTALSLGHLRNFLAEDFLGDLSLDFTGQAVVDNVIQDVLVVGAQGDNKITFTDTIANLTVDTFDGDDVIIINKSDIPPPVRTIPDPLQPPAGDALIDVSSGNNNVNIAYLNGAITVTAADGINIVEVAETTGNVDITLGNGDNEVTANNTTGDVDVTSGVAAVDATNTVDVTDTTGNVDITLGNGSNTVVVTNTEVTDTAFNVNITLGNGDNSVIATNTSGDVGIKSGVYAVDGKNTVDVTVADNVDIALGNGSNTVTVADATNGINFESGDGVTDLVVSNVVGESIITVGNVVDRITNINKVSITGGSGIVDITVGDGATGVSVESATPGTNRDGNVTIEVGTVLGAGIDAEGFNAITVNEINGDAIIIAGEGENDVSFAAGKGDISINVGDGLNDIDIQGIPSGVELRTGDVLITAGKNDNAMTMLLVEGDIELTATDGDNDVYVVGVVGDVKINLGEGDNDITLQRFEEFFELTGDVTVDVLDGNNEFNISDVIGDMTLKAGDGGNRFTVSDGSGDVNIEAGNGSNVVYVSSSTLGEDRGPGAVSVVLGNAAIANVVSLEGIDGAASVTALDGENYVEILGATGAVTVDLGDDTNLIIIKEALGGIVVDAGNGKNDIEILDGANNIFVTAGNGGNIIEIANADSLNITVLTGSGDDDLFLDTDRFGDSLGQGVDVDLGGGNNTLTLGGKFSGNVSFANATVENVNNLVVATAVYVPGSFAGTVDITELSGSLESVTFEEVVTVDAGGSITISGAPVTSSLTFDKDANFDGLLQINDVKDLTLNVGLGTIGDLTGFSFGKNGSFVAADLETLTINLDVFSTFIGATAVDGTDVSKLTTVTVNGVFADDNADFTMDFDTDQSGAIKTIDLSNFSGDAVVNVYSVTEGKSFKSMDITIGDGNLDYSIYDGVDFVNANQDTFIFTNDIGFGTVNIEGFEIGGSATSDELDLSVFGISSGSELIFEIIAGGGNNNMSIVSRNEDFDGEILLIGNYDVFDVTTVASLNIIYS